MFTIDTTISHMANLCALVNYENAQNGVTTNYTETDLNLIYIHEAQAGDKNTMVVFEASEISGERGQATMMYTRLAMDNTVDGGTPAAYSFPRNTSAIDIMIQVRNIMHLHPNGYRMEFDSPPTAPGEYLLLITAEEDTSNLLYAAGSTYEVTITIQEE